MSKQSASKTAKLSGLESLAEVSRLSGVSRQTLSNWSKHKPQLFEVVVAGCREMKKE